VDEVLGNLDSTARRAIGHTKTVLDIWTISTVKPVRCILFVFWDTFCLQDNADLRVIGQTTRIERSTLEQVRARIAYLREKTKEASNAKSFDFDQRLAEVKAKEAALRVDRKAKKQAEKDKARLELVKDSTVDGEDDMAKMMGFGGFGSTKKK